MSKHKARFVWARPDEFIGMVLWNEQYPSIPGCSPMRGKPIPSGKAKEKFRNALRESIKREGFRNPVIGYAVEGGLLLQYGASRLRAAKELGIQIKVIVMDCVGRYEDAPEVTNDNYQEFFYDVPRTFRIRDGYIEHSYHIARRDKGPSDPAGYVWLGDDPDGVIDDELHKVREERDGKVQRT